MLKLLLFQKEILQGYNSRRGNASRYPTPHVIKSVAVKLIRYPTPHVIKSVVATLVVTRTDFFRSLLRRSCIQLDLEIYAFANRAIN